MIFRKSKIANYFKKFSVGCAVRVRDSENTKIFWNARVVSLHPFSVDYPEHPDWGVSQFKPQDVTSEWIRIEEKHTHVKQSVKAPVIPKEVKVEQLTCLNVLTTIVSDLTPAEAYHSLKSLRSMFITNNNAHILTTKDEITPVDAFIKSCILHITETTKVKIDSAKMLGIWIALSTPAISMIDIMIARYLALGKNDCLLVLPKVSKNTVKKYN